jgi:galactonate dehydratase
LKIVDIKAYLVGAQSRNWVFVKVLTDEGIDGIGEAYSVGPDEATVAVLQDFKRWLLGRDPRDIEGLWHEMYNFTRFPGGSVVNSAISGIEHALWDILGKSLGAPVYRLLGGRCREKIRVYVHAGGSTPSELSEAVLSVAKRGFNAVKVSPFPPGSDRMPWNLVLKASEDRMEAVRNAVGEGFDVAVDIHAKILEPSRAVQLCKVLEPFRPLFLEEPLRPENPDALAEVAKAVEAPIATGEQLYTKWGFREVLEKRAADIIQPDVCCAGGILECRKIAAMAEAYYVSVAPHNPMGPVATAVNVHLAAGIQNFLILEYIPDEGPPRTDVVKKPMEIEGGYLKIPEEPGLGIELREEGLCKYPPKPWRRTPSYREDGSPALL